MQKRRSRSARPETGQLVNFLIAFILVTAAVTALGTRLYRDYMNRHPPIRHPSILRPD
jgi:hypothetical protein